MKTASQGHRRGRAFLYQRTGYSTKQGNNSESNRRSPVGGSQARENQKWLIAKVTSYQKKKDIQVKTVL